MGAGLAVQFCETARSFGPPPKTITRRTCEPAGRAPVLGVRAGQPRGARVVHALLWRLRPGRLAPQFEDHARRSSTRRASAASSPRLGSCGSFNWPIATASSCVVLGSHGTLREQIFPSIVRKL